MLKKNNTWITEVKQIFTKINCTDVFNNNTTILNLKTFLNHAKDKLLNIHIDQWKNQYKAQAPHICKYKTILQKGELLPD